jgi:signal peptidase I
MARKIFVLDTLLEKGEVSWKPHGNSMTPRIDSGDQVLLKKVPVKALQVGDIVYAKVKGNYYLHLLSAIDEPGDRYQISNNHGYVNGWVAAHNIFGACTQVKEKIILSDKEIEKRLGNSDT